VVRDVIVPVGWLLFAVAGIMLSYDSLGTHAQLAESQAKYRVYGEFMGALRTARVAGKYGKGRHAGHEPGDRMAV